MSEAKLSSMKTLTNFFYQTLLPVIVLISIIVLFTWPPKPNQPVQAPVIKSEPLTLPTKSLTLEQKYNLPDGLNCLTEAIYYEARGESSLGRKAVASVVLNRVRSKYYPNSICEVVNQPYQFSYTLNRYVVSDTSAWRASKETAKFILSNSSDYSNGALFYYNPAKLPSTPLWVDEAYFIKITGSHRFYSWHRLK